MSSIIKTVSGQAVCIDGNDIDTDQIIPARFLKEITFDRMGDYLFADARFEADGTLKSHPLNAPENSSAAIMVVGRNFGCGSSREHAPQSIKRFGIRAIIGESFAEIFAGNCTSLGVPVVTTSEDNLTLIRKLITELPGTPITIDLAQSVVVIGTSSLPIAISASRQHSFINGTWDATALLSAQVEKIKEVANRLPYVSNFA